MTRTFKVGDRVSVGRNYWGTIKELSSHECKALVVLDSQINYKIEEWHPITKLILLRKKRKDKPREWTILVDQKGKMYHPDCPFGDFQNSKEVRVREVLK